MRVLLVSPYSLSVFGGVQGQVLGLARSLRELGVDARVVAPCDGPPPERGIVTVGPSTNFSSNGSIIPCSTAIFLIHLSALIEGIVVSGLEARGSGPDFISWSGTSATASARCWRESSSPAENRT